MSLFESMSRDLGTVQRVNIQEVRMNKLNFYEYQDDVINSLKESILENGQMENAIAYLDDFDENGDLTCIHLYIDDDFKNIYYVK